MPLHLRTLGEVSLAGDAGIIALDDPRLAALIVMLAVAGDAGLADDELLLRLTPDATAAKGRVEIARLVALGRERLGREGAIVRTSNGCALAPGIVSLDVRVLAHDAPAECAAFLRGFGLPDSPEFHEWLAGTRRRVAPIEQDGSSVADPGTRDQHRSAVDATSRPINRRRRMVARVSAMAVSLVVLAGATRLYLGQSHAMSGFSTGDALLLADVENSTGDSLLGLGITSAAAVALQQSGRLRLYPRSRLAEVYRLMEIANRDTALSFELAKAVAQRDGVRFVLGLRVVRADGVDGTYRVTGRLVDVTRPDHLVETSANARGRSDVLTALDHVLVSVRMQLGESRREVADRQQPLPLVTTGSLEALRSYAEGSAAWGRGDYALANDLWHRAVDLDTGFAIAYGALARYYYFNHDRAQGEHYMAGALDRANRLSEGERLRLLETAWEYRGRLDSAAIYDGRLASRFPSTVTWYNYGTSLMDLGRDSEAIVALTTSLRYDPRHASAYVNLATVAKHSKRYQDAANYYERAGRLDSAVLYRANINGEWAGTLVKLGRYAEAESAFARMSRRPRVGDRALGFRSLGYLAMWQGRLDEAAAHFQDAVDAAVQTKSPLGEMRSRLLLASTYDMVGRAESANAEIARSLALLKAPSIEPAALAILATSCIKAGRVADARSVLEISRARAKPDNAVDSAAVAYTAGLVALARHRPDDALPHLRAANQLPFRTLLLSLQAEVYRELGQTDSARAAVVRLRSEAGFGVEGQDEWLHAPLVLGDLMLVAHDTAGAMRQYQAILEQWRGGQPGLADVIAARSKLAALNQQR